MQAGSESSDDGNNLFDDYCSWRKTNSV